MSMNVIDAQCCRPLSAPRLSATEAEATAALFKALGDPARVRLVNLLALSDEPVCVCELIDPLGLSQPTVSHHLKKLTTAGLLRRTVALQRDGLLGWTFRQSVFQRRAGLVTAEAVTAAGRGGYPVLDAAAGDAVALADATTPGLFAPFLTGPERTSPDRTSAVMTPQKTRK